MGKATRRTLPSHLLTDRNYYTRATWQTERRHPAVAADYASLSRSLPPQKIYMVGLRHLSSRRSVADVRADMVARHGPVRSSQSIESRSHYRSPNNHDVLYGPWQWECGTYEDPRNKYNKGWRQRRRIDKRSTVATSRNSLGTRRHPAPRAHCLKEVSRTLGQRDYTRETCGDGRLLQQQQQKHALSLCLCLTLSRVYACVCVCVCVSHVSTNYPLWTRREWTPS